MRKGTASAIVNGKTIKMTLQFWDSVDRPVLKELYDEWKIFGSDLKNIGAGGVNLPEGISESAFCLDFNSNAVRIISEGHLYDCYDIVRGKGIQIKATSVPKDITSFGPHSIWDELYFLDFYKSGNFNGEFDVYLIPNNLIYNFKVNAT